MKLSDYAKQCHAANKKWWFHIDTGEPLDRNKGELLMLMVTELSECCEGERKDLPDDKLPHRRMNEVETVDFLIRGFDFFAGFGWDIDAAIFEEPKDAWDFESLNRFAGEMRKDSPELFTTNHAESLMKITARVSSCYIALEAGELEEAQEQLGIAICAALAYAGSRCFDLDGAYKDKNAYNAVREDHKHEARRLAGGKKF